MSLSDSERNGGRKELKEIGAGQEKTKKFYKDLIKSLEEKLRQAELEKEKDEEEIRNSHNFVFALISAIPVAKINVNGEFSWVSKSLCELFGYKEEELKGGKIGGFYQNKKEALVEYLRLKENGRIETVMMHKNGNLIDVAVRLIPMDSVSLVVMFESITERKKLEAQLVQAQKMEAIGTLAGGVAHNFNNLLTVIMGFATLSRWECKKIYESVDLERTKKLVDVIAQIKSIEKAASDASGLSMELLNFARGGCGEFEKNLTDVSSLLAETASMFGKTTKGILIEVESTGASFWAEIDKGQISQVLMNLFVNASHAMPNGGNLNLAIQMVDLKRDLLKPYEINPGQYVCLTVNDNGLGMDEKTMARIFEPFFTTKEMGCGTGLGLATVYSIVKRHKGYIEVYSTLGVGTTFKVFLPAATSKLQVVTKYSVKNNPVKGNGEKIIIIDDESDVRGLISEYLTGLNYRIKEFGDGNKAVEDYEDNFTDISLILLDMIMPQTCGEDIFEKLKLINPDANIILMSGFDRNGRVDQFIEKGCYFVQKPFNLSNFSELIRSVLEK
jgi:two-component system, cell cycle sensor histidine kinase and response regulator CckA